MGRNFIFGYILVFFAKSVPQLITQMRRVIYQIEALSDFQKNFKKFSCREKRVSNF